ncbi:BBP7 family outer membrane beta-barrel protein [Rubripirellula amarantea]|nr:BBP7 family outer membrane beta-barrel protein [Rubripirellula amarantea]
MNKLPLWIAALASVVAFHAGNVTAEPPRAQIADIDFEASGFVIPAGASEFTHGLVSNPVQQAGMTMPQSYGVGQTTPIPTAMYPQGNIAQVGYFSSSCDDGGCDTGGCDSGCGCGASHGPLFSGQWLGCNGPIQDCEPILSGGLIGKMNGSCRMGGPCGSCGGACGGSGCQAAAGGAGLSGLRHMCLFCRGDGCSACQLANPAAFTSIFTFLKPYSEGGKCQQRWYDISAEALVLGHNSPGSNLGVVTTRDSQANAVPVLFGGAGTDADLEAGVRLSGALIFGPGGSFEGTYMGGHEWTDSRTVTDPGANLYSFVSNFGDDPPGIGYDDTDRSVSQTIASSSKFHSGELNYRRRTMGPYCRFQGSWLAGLRYLRFDNGLRYSAVGDTTNATTGLLRYFESDGMAKNDFFGAQLGFDLWYHVIPGISLGVEAKGAWGQNDYETSSIYRSNSLANQATAGQLTLTDKDRDITTMAELQFAMSYRLSHSWAFRSSYYLIAMDDVATTALDRDTIIAVVDNDPATQTSGTSVTFDSLVLNGFSLGAEYTW